MPPKVYELNESFPPAFKLKLDDSKDSCEPHGVFVYTVTKMQNFSSSGNLTFRQLLFSSKTYLT